ncbi:uncharacterized protein [Procambarus clarkii]|uniref:uncharacterized protein n=1 Tax=Procambarus clarkii TaxID=6728 RepID=UPI0037449443
MNALSEVPTKHPEVSGVPRVLPEVSGAPPALLEVSGAPPALLEVSGAPPALLEFSGAPPALLEVSGAPPALPEVSGAPRVLPEVSGAPPALLEVSGVPPALLEVSGAPPALLEVSGAPPALPEVSGAPPALLEVSGAPPARLEVFGAPPALPEVSRAPPALLEVSRAPPALLEVSGAPPALLEVSRAPPARPGVSGAPPARLKVSGAPPALLEVSGSPPARPGVSGAPPALLEVSGTPPALFEVSGAPRVLPEVTGAPPARLEVSEVPPALPEVSRAPPALLEVSRLTPVNYEQSLMMASGRQSLRPMPRVTSPRLHCLNTHHQPSLNGGEARCNNRIEILTPPEEEEATIISARDKFAPRFSPSMLTHPAEGMLQYKQQNSEFCSTQRALHTRQLYWPQQPDAQCLSSLNQPPWGSPWQYYMHHTQTAQYSQYCQSLQGLLGQNLSCQHPQGSLAQDLPSRYQHPQGNLPSHHQQPQGSSAQKPLHHQQPQGSPAQNPSHHQQPQGSSAQKPQGSPAQTLPSHHQHPQGSPAQKPQGSPAQNPSHHQQPQGSPAQKPQGSPAQNPSHHQQPQGSPAQNLPSHHQQPQGSPAQKPQGSPAQKPLHHQQPQGSPAQNPSHHQQPQGSPAQNLPSHHQQPHGSSAQNPSHQQPQGSPAQNPSYHQQPQGSPAQNPSHHQHPQGSSAQNPSHQQPQGSSAQNPSHHKQPQGSPAQNLTSHHQQPHGSPAQYPYHQQFWCSPAQNIPLHHQHYKRSAQNSSHHQQLWGSPHYQALQGSFVQYPQSQQLLQGTHTQYPLHYQFQQGSFAQYQSLNQSPYCFKQYPKEHPASQSSHIQYLPPHLQTPHNSPAQYPVYHKSPKCPITQHHQKYTHTQYSESTDPGGHITQLLTWSKNYEPKSQYQHQQWQQFHSTSQQHTAQNYYHKKLRGKTQHRQHLGDEYLPSSEVQMHGQHILSKQDSQTARVLTHTTHHTASQSLEEQQIPSTKPNYEEAHKRLQSLSSNALNLNKGSESSLRQMVPMKFDNGVQDTNLRPRDVFQQQMNLQRPMTNTLNHTYNLEGTGEHQFELPTQQQSQDNTQNSCQKICTVDNVVRNDYLNSENQLSNVYLIEYVSESSAIFCHTCDSRVTRENFLDHLFFGRLQCNHCCDIIVNCRSLQHVRKFPGKCMKHKNYKHNFSKWLECPIDYLKYHITLKLKGFGKYKNASQPNGENFARSFAAYLNNLKILDKVNPWMSAISQCQEYLDCSGVLLELCSKTSSGEKLIYQKNLAKQSTNIQETSPVMQSSNEHQNNPTMQSSDEKQYNCTIQSTNDNQYNPMQSTDENRCNPDKHSSHKNQNQTKQNAQEFKNKKQRSYTKTLWKNDNNHSKSLGKTREKNSSVTKQQNEKNKPRNSLAVEPKSIEKHTLGISYEQKKEHPPKKAQDANNISCHAWDRKDQVTKQRIIRDASDISRTQAGVTLQPETCQSERILEGGVQESEVPIAELNPNNLVKKNGKRKMNDCDTYAKHSKARKTGLVCNEEAIANLHTQVQLQSKACWSRGLFQCANWKSEELSQQEPCELKVTSPVYKSEEILQQEFYELEQISQPEACGAGISVQHEIVQSKVISETNCCKPDPMHQLVVCPSVPVPQVTVREQDATSQLKISDVRELQTKFSPVVCQSETAYQLAGIQSEVTSQLLAQPSKVDSQYETFELSEDSNHFPALNPNSSISCIESSTELATGVQDASDMAPLTELATGPQYGYCMPTLGKLAPEAPQDDSNVEAASGCVIESPIRPVIEIPDVAAAIGYTIEEDRSGCLTIKKKEMSSSVGEKTAQRKILDLQAGWIEGASDDSGAEMVALVEESRCGEEKTHENMEMQIKNELEGIAVSFPEEESNPRIEHWPRQIWNPTVVNGIQLPMDHVEDNRYLVIRYPEEECPEECPECYCTFCASMLYINYKTLLITLVCPDCNLSIFIVPDEMSMSRFSKDVKRANWSL